MSEQNRDPEKAGQWETFTSQGKLNPENASEKPQDIDPASASEDHETDDEAITAAYPVQPDFPKLEATASNVLSKVASRLTTRSLPDPGPPPDGGVKAWTQCAMAWLVVFNTWGYTNSFGTFQAYYTESLHQSPSTVSWVGSLQVWVLFFIGAFSGRALDAGYFLPAYIVGITMQLLGIFMTSLATEYWQLLLSQGICTGIGSGIFFCPSMALLSTYFSKHRGLAIAIATTGNSAGGLVYPLVVRELLPRIGFGWTIRVLGFMNLACLAVVLVFMRARLPPRKSDPLIEWAAFKEPEYILFIGGMCFLLAPLYFTYYYVASYGRSALGMSYSDSIILLMIYNGVGIPARVACGYIADRFLGVMNTFIPLLIVNAICAYSWIGVTNITGYYVFICFYGVTIASWQSLFPTTVAALTRDIRKGGGRLGMVFSVTSVAALIGPPLGGGLISAEGGSYMGAQAWAGSSALIGVGLITGARVYRFGTSVKRKC